MKANARLKKQQMILAVICRKWHLQTAERTLQRSNSPFSGLPCRDKLRVPFQQPIKLSNLSSLLQLSWSFLVLLERDNNASLKLRVLAGERGVSNDVEASGRVVDQSRIEIISNYRVMPATRSIERAEDQCAIRRKREDR